MNLLISFSGGETSAYMTHWLLEYNKTAKRWDQIVVVFANTGEEREETLEFVKRCDEYFGFNTVWIEAVQHHGERRAPTAKVVTFETASRKGEPFEEAIKKYGIPNQKFKDCTRNLKSIPITAYARSIGWPVGTYELAIGIRVDEIDRVSVHAAKRNIIYPLVRIHPVTKPQINTWWRAQPFRLELKHWQGNCKWCWKKSKRKHFTILRHHPEDFEFPLRMEALYGKVGPEFRHDPANRRDPLPEDYRRTFFRGNQSAEQLIAEFKERGHLVEDYRDDAQIFDEEFDVGAGCEESCEVFSDEDWRATPEDEPEVPVKPSIKAQSGGKIILLRPDNPRRVGTHGYRSWEIASSEPGMTVSRYKKLGGRMNDLRWDIKHNWARIEND